jgi:mono/diheme cytochrome c family protein
MQNESRQHTMKFGFILLLLTALSAAAAEPASKPALPSDHAERLTRGLNLFQKQVRPILIDNCVKCHGGEKIKGGLDLTTREGLLKGGEDGLVVIHVLDRVAVVVPSTV